jgi:hypothetical protein
MRVSKNRLRDAGDMLDTLSNPESRNSIWRGRGVAAIRRPQHKGAQGHMYGSESISGYTFVRVLDCADLRRLRG